MTNQVFLGFQGWAHPQWKKRWDMPSCGSYDMLQRYSREFPTVEVDDTFYGVPPEPLMRRWRESVPADFRFSLKAPQQITHEQRFSGQGGLLKRFLDRVSMLEDNLGPILLLAPPGFEPHEESRAALQAFVRELPTGFDWALDLRNGGWFTDDLHDLLSRHKVAVVIADNRWIRRASMLELAKRPTAEFAYVRWNSPLSPNPSGEDVAREERITAEWVNTLERLSSLVSGVYGYFNIDAYGNGTRILEETRSRLDRRRLEASVSGAATSADKDVFQKGG